MKWLRVLCTIAVSLGLLSQCKSTDKGDEEKEPGLKAEQNEAGSAEVLAKLPGAESPLALDGNKGGPVYKVASYRLEVRSAPKFGDNIITYLDRGTRIRGLETLESWIRVGQDAWVHGRYLERE